MPQWDLLNFLSKEASRYPSFTLRLGWEATGLIEEDGTIKGIRANTPDGPQEIRADLTVGCDGRHAVSREAAHLPLAEEGVPIDVLWFRISRQPSDPEIGIGYVNYGRLIVLINRIDYFQTAYIIAKGGFDQIQQDGLDQFHASLERIVPFLAGRTAEIDSWDKVKLLSVQINHLERWSRPGLLCIGDAAHAMSPVGGIGINIAVQDAVATANLLTEPLRTGTLTARASRAGPALSRRRRPQHAACTGSRPPRPQPRPAKSRPRQAGTSAAHRDCPAPIPALRCTLRRHGTATGAHPDQTSLTICLERLRLKLV